MRVLELRAENFARLKAVEIRPDGPVVQISGANSHGKSSTLNAIWVALKGKAVAPPVPVNTGAERAVIRLKLGTDHDVEAMVTRTFETSKDDPSGYTSEVKVELAGKKVRVKPQDLINSWLGAITIDPLQFARAKARDQFDVLKLMVRGFDFEANATARKAAFDKRTDVNRQAKEQRTLAEKIDLPSGKVPADEPNVQALADQLRAALAHNNEIETRKSRRDEARSQADRFVAEARELQAKATALLRQAQEIDERLDAADDLPDPMDTTAISAKMNSASADHQAWLAARQRKQHEEAATAAEVTAESLTADIASLDEEKVEAIERAKLPVQGLSLGDDMVLLNGLPFSQAGTAEKLRTSIAIAMADNPTLRVMLIDDATELDSKSMEIVRQLAEEHQYQLWMCIVSESDKVGFYIENGEVKE